MRDRSVYRAREIIFESVRYKRLCAVNSFSLELRRRKANQLVINRTDLWLKKESVKHESSM